MKKQAQEWRKPREWENNLPIIAQMAYPKCLTAAKVTNLNLAMTWVVFKRGNTDIQ